jgi:hypothetical protein
VCRLFSRPDGTRDDDDGYPALKRRAIVGLSLWEGDGFCIGRLVGVRQHPDTLCLANFRLSRWDERRPQNYFAMDVWGNWRLNLQYEGIFLA